jgi:hypothetical protein
MGEYDTTVRFFGAQILRLGSLCLLVNKAFTPRVVATIESPVKEILSQLLDRIERSTE